MEKGDTDLASLLKNYALHKEITPAMVKHYWTEMLHAVNVIHKVMNPCIKVTRSLSVCLSIPKDLAYHVVLLYSLASQFS